ncbi:sensor histidine kinase [Vagococcus humatus]|uniref:Sensor histidine kinase n=1 Tax=Vagococcus humatus TaxID=1889241 RepID=A0A429Z5B6_9ENTE|nr:sensor histidine kinase [Vagococcus humatus]RST88859.1 sensor histidine kinase [Vagococcus humatus]
MFKRKNKQTMLNLMRLYSSIMIGIISVFALIVSGVNIYNSYNEANNVIERASYQTTQFLNEKDQILLRVAKDLTDSPKKIQNLSKYFQLNQADYLAYSLHGYQAETQDNFFYLPNFSTEFFFVYPDIAGLGISFTEEKQAFYSTQKLKEGQKRDKLTQKDQYIQLARPLINPDNLETVGIVSLDIEKTALIKELANICERYPAVEVFAIKNTNDVAFQYSPTPQPFVDRISKLSELVDKQDRYYQYSTASGIDVVAKISTVAVIKQELSRLWLILFISLVLDVILIVTLRLTFKDYVAEVTHINNELHQVAKDDKIQRISVDNQEGELAEIAANINHMIDRINQYIQDIYQLEIEQKDAHMKALQAQINPHFLYNTLEYIRMYAVNIEAEELADVVYAFASLLRNNISQEKTTTLEQELLFCEKYVYLYQMRYPHRIAYSFSLDEELRELELPKFTLQPLVENYFVHGIDYSRVDNALRVVAVKEGSFAKIMIEDNGRGMSSLEKEKLLTKLEEPAILHKSIGVQNVNERLKGYFGETYRFTLTTSSSGGVLITLYLPILT